jgi:hypothetical protein
MRLAMSRFTTVAVAAVVGIAWFGIVVPDPGSVLAGSRALAQNPPPAAAPSTVSAAGITLQSVSVDLPNSDRTFSGGAEADAINNNCLTCHSVGMVLNQPALTRSAWQQEVDKMRAQYKAPLNEADLPAIVAYLAAHKGAQ